MARVRYQMSVEDLRTFDRWHAYGAAILLAVLLLMPWILGLGPNAARPAASDAAARTPTAPPPAAPASTADARPVTGG